MCYIQCAFLFLCFYGVAEVYSLNTTQPTNGGFTVYIPQLPDCWCSCEPAHVPEDKPEFDEFVKQWKTRLILNLLLNPDGLSATISKKISAKDNRISAISVGCVGLKILTLSALMIICMDLTNIRYVSGFLKGINP